VQRPPTKVRTGHTSMEAIPVPMESSSADKELRKTSGLGSEFWEPAWTQTVYQLVTRKLNQTRVIVAAKFYGDPDNEPHYLSIRGVEIFLSRTHYLCGSFLPGTDPGSIGARSLLSLVRSGSNEDILILESLWPHIFRNHQVTHSCDTVDKFLDKLPSYSSIKPLEFSNIEVIGVCSISDLESFDIGFQGKYVELCGRIFIPSRPSNDSLHLDWGFVSMLPWMFRKYILYLSLVYPQVNSIPLKRLQVHWKAQVSFVSCSMMCAGKQFTIKHNRNVNPYVVLARMLVGLAGLIHVPQPTTPVPSGSLPAVPVETFRGDVSESVTIATE